MNWQKLKVKWLNWQNSKLALNWQKLKVKWLNWQNSKLEDWNEIKWKLEGQLCIFAKKNIYIINTCKILKWLKINNCFICKISYPIANNIWYINTSISLKYNENVRSSDQDTN